MGFSFRVSGVRVQFEVSDFDPAKGAKGARCHFDRREKSVSEPSHSLGMTDLAPSLSVLGVLAR
jgi:hypothetical protein